MRRRCLNPENQAYENYGGRGITICKRWDSFEVFLADMGPKPSSSNRIDELLVPQGSRTRKERVDG